MRLLVISHTSHYLRSGEVVGWGATVREIDELVAEFGPLTHVAWLHDAPAPGSSLPYRSGAVRFVGVRPAGGTRLRDKLAAILAIPMYAKTIISEMRRHDAVHVRCPAGISLVAVLLLPFLRRPRIRWIKYAGNWKPTGPEAASYRFQRWWLRRAPHRAVVTVNGGWSDDPPHVHDFLNPCLDDAELAVAARLAHGKRLQGSVRLAFVGRLNPAKGAHRAVGALQRLAADGVEAELDIVGDGPQRAEIEAMVAHSGLAGRVRLHGALARDRLDGIYGAAHFVVLPSDTEGWPKILAEGMAYGAVPLASSVGSVAQKLEAFAVGRVFAPADVEHLSRHVRDYVRDPGVWLQESRRAVAVASRFTYGEFTAAVRALLADAFPEQKARSRPSMASAP
jgi:glycosyltransferase involved in cell wall biosynthesis